MQLNGVLDVLHSCRRKRKIKNTDIDKSNVDQTKIKILNQGVHSLL